jgi:hypothetical protein
MILLCKKIVAKSREVKTGFNPTESSKEGYGSKRAVLPMMMNKRHIARCNIKCKDWQ